MERLVIEVDTHKQIEFLFDLLRRYDFIHSIKKERAVRKEKEDLPIERPKKNADIMALAGIWKDNPRSIEEIREKAWKRN